MVRSSRTAGNWFTVTGVTVALLLAITSCSSSSNPTTSTNSAGKPGGTLVVGVTLDPSTLFPWKVTQTQSIAMLGIMYDTLTQFDKSLNVVPGLAKSWNVSSDGLTVTFNLRSGVTFANGAAFSSADVKSSLDRIKLESTAAIARGILGSVSSVEAPDPNTVVLKLAKPDASLLANLANVNTSIISAQDTEATLSAKPNGTGPYSFSARTPNQSLTLVENKKYWGGEPTLGTIRFQIIPDESSIVSALQAGNVQLSLIDDPLVAKTAATSTVKVTKTPQLAYHVLQLNARKGPLTDVNVRLAIQCAVDRQEVLDTAALGEGVVTGPITSPAYKSDPNARPCPKVDLKKAKEYLAKANITGEIKLDTIVSQGQYSSSVNEAQNLKSQLAKIGITLNLEVLESGTYIARWVAGTFDAAVARNGGTPDPDGMYGRYFTSTGNLNKVAGYSSPALDQLFAEGKATSDVAKRKVIYSNLSKNLEDNAAWIWLFSSYSYSAVATSVSGFIPMSNGSLQYLRTTTVK